MTPIVGRTSGLVLVAVVAGCSHGGSPTDKNAGDAARPDRSHDGSDGSPPPSDADADHPTRPTDASTDAGEGKGDGGQPLADWVLCRQALLGCEEDTPPVNDPSCPATIPRDEASCGERGGCYYCSTPLTEFSAQQFAGCREDGQWNVTRVECGS